VPPADARLALDAAVVPSLLLLVARHLAAHDPPRVLGWRLLHEGALAGWPLGPLVPRPSGALDRDPIALALAAMATGLALVYLVAALCGARTRTRLALIAVGATLLVAVPTAAFMAMGVSTGRPYGQDGGVVQLPLAIDRILSGQSPYGADYSASVLGRQARVSDFWTEHGGNPILHHHAYLPGTHLLMLPFLPLSRAVLGTFDPRIVTLLAFAAAGLLAFRLASDGARGLAACAAVWLSPLVYWQQIFGANDVLVAALLLATVHLCRAGRPGAAAAVLGLACATKQLAWPFAPFVIAHLSGARTPPALFAPPARARLLRASAIAGVVFLVVVAPVAALDLRAFWRDIVVYNAGLPGGDNYPLGGTPGLGLANLIVYLGGVSSLRDYVPLGWLYLALVPLGLGLLREQLRRGAAVDSLLTGSAALLASLYVSRVFHPNYLILPAVLLPAAVAAGASLAVEALVGGLLLLAVAVEVTEGGVFAATWADALAVRWPAAREGALALLAPRAGADLTRDPLGLVFGALASGAGIGLVLLGVMRARARWRAAVVAAALAAVMVVPTLIVMRVGRLSGVPRAEDGWSATAWPRDGRATVALREAWSRSFRRDPPGPVAPSAGAPAVPAVSRLLSAIGAHDPRALVLAAALVIAALVMAAAPAGAALPRIACILVLPAAIIGAIFGSGDLVLLALVLLAAALAERGHRVMGGMLLGLTTALFPRLLPAVPLLVAASGAPRDRRGWSRAALGAGVGAAVGCLPAALGTGLARPALGAGLGLANLRLYAGAMPGTPDLIGPALVLLTAVASLWIALRMAAPPPMALAAAAAALMAALWLASSADPDDVVTPIALLALAASARHVVFTRTLPRPTISV